MMKANMLLLALCAAATAEAAQPEEHVTGYGAYQLSSRFKTCIAKELHNKTLAQQELECLQDELKEVKAAMDGTYQDLVILMKKNHWKDRLKILQAAQKEFNDLVKRCSNSTTALYGCRMAGFAHLYEIIDYMELRRKHLQHLLDYYKG